MSANVDPQVAEKLVGDLKSDYSKAELSPTDQAMMDYAVKLTLTPQNMDANDVSNLREVGFEDLAIHDICAIVGYFAFVNRIADGLGVELES